MAADGNSILMVNNQSPDLVAYEELIPEPERYCIYKFHSDGTPDSSFANNGIKEYEQENELPFPAYLSPTDALIQPDGKLLVSFSDFYTATLRRYNPDGSQDTAFGDRVIFEFSLGTYGVNTRIALRDDGKIICAVGYNYPAHIKISRLLQNGSIDSTFDGDGIKTTSGALVDLKLDDDQKILLLLAGYLRRYDENGVMDTAFANDGNFYFTSGQSMELQSDNKILLRNMSSVQRISDSGLMDSTFGGNGISDPIPSLSSYAAKHIRLQDDGNILVADVGYSSDFKIVRLLNEIETGYESDPTNSSLSIFPNPTSSLLYISYPFTPNESLTITDLSGKILQQEKANLCTNYYSLNVENLPAGIYLLNVQTKSNSFSAKFVKE